MSLSARHNEALIVWDSRCIQPRLNPANPAPCGACGTHFAVCRFTLLTHQIMNKQAKLQICSQMLRYFAAVGVAFCGVVGVAHQWGEWHIPLGV